MAAKVIDWISRLIDVTNWALYVIAFAGLTGAVLMGIAVNMVTWVRPYAPIIFVLLIPFAAVFFSATAAYCMSIFTRRSNAELEKTAVAAVILAGQIDRALKHVQLRLKEPRDLMSYLASSKAMRDKFERLGFETPKPATENVFDILELLSRYFRVVGMQLQQGNYHQAREDASLLAEIDLASEIVSR